MGKVSSYCVARIFRRIDDFVRFVGRNFREFRLPILLLGKNFRRSLASFCPVFHVRLRYIQK